MNSLYIREMFNKVRQSLRCPACGSSISPSAIDISVDSNDQCSFSASCERCRVTFGGNAKMMSVLTPKGEKMNASSRLNDVSLHDSRISFQEKVEVKDALKTATSLASLFPKKEKKDSDSLSSLNG